MRILGMLKADASSEAGAPPSKEMIGRMGVFIEEVTKAGVMRSRRTQRSWRRSHAIHCLSAPLQAAWRKYVSQPVVKLFTSLIIRSSAISQGKTPLLRSGAAGFICARVRVIIGRPVHCRVYPTAPAFYPIPVRQLRACPPASSPPRLAATQCLQLAVPITRARRGLHLQRQRHAWHTKRLLLAEEARQDVLTKTFPGRSRTPGRIVKQQLRPFAADPPACRVRACRPPARR
jgi:hypothetical protein